MTKEKNTKLDLNERILVQALICTILQRCSKDKSIPFRTRLRLKKAAKNAKGGLLPEEKIRKTFSYAVGIHLASDLDDEGLDRLLDVPVFSDKVKKLYEDCRKKAIANREEFYKNNG